MRVSFGIKCMYEGYYNHLVAHISEIHYLMLQIHGHAFHKRHTGMAQTTAYKIERLEPNRAAKLPPPKQKESRCPLLS
jgi:hypothetical protein